MKRRIVEAGSYVGLTVIFGQWIGRSIFEREIIEPLTKADLLTPGKRDPREVCPKSLRDIFMEHTEVFHDEIMECFHLEGKEIIPNPGMESAAQALLDAIVDRYEQKISGGKVEREHLVDPAKKFAANILRKEEGK